MADPTCALFDSASPLDRNTLNRFVVGADPAPRKMTGAEIRALGDPVATFLFAKGRIPRTAQQTVEMIKSAAPAKSGLKEQLSFVVAEGHEGSQVLPRGQAKITARNLRFVVTLGSLTGTGPDVFVSASSPSQPGGIEVIGWDSIVGGFNWYRSTGDALWMFAGNSRDALRDLSRRKGPFNSHPSGSILMKELKTPWIHWDSPAAIMRDDTPGDSRRTHKWFKDREPQGAIDLEVAARAAMERWAKARFAELRGAGGTVARPKQIMEHILDTPTANLHSTHVTNASLDLTPVQLDLPRGFFVDADGLSGVDEPGKFGLGLDPPPLFEVSSKLYAKVLKKFKVRIEGGGFKRPGDAHFCFVVPERAFEDLVMLREAIEIGLVSERLATCLLMVDPWNPVFSARRRALLQHIPSTATIATAKSSFSQEVANRILAAAKMRGTGSPEAEFAKRWNVGPRFRREFNRILNGYYKKVQARLKTQAGFEPYFRLAEERRRAFSKLPIAEFPLLLPTSDIPPAPRRMQFDATVAES
jgi:hypothetical protein